MWAGKTIAILASGPSLTPDQCRLVAEAGLPRLVINDSFRLAPDADLLYAADAQWWAVHAQEALKFRGLKVTAHESCAFRDVLLLKRTGDKGFDPDPGCVRTGGNSGFQALHVAIHAKAAKVLLLGFDMNPKGGHWFGQHKRPLRTTDADTYRRWIDRFPALSGRGTEIVNCTPASALRCFPMDELKNHV